MARPATSSIRRRRLRREASAIPPAPVNSVKPAITGTLVRGQTLIASTGTWTNSPTSYAYQWKGNGVDISGATSSTFALTVGQVGQTITVTVTASNGQTATVTSDPVGPVAEVDTTPNAFTFTDVTGATVSTVYTSNTITVSGINSPAAISITGGTYSITGGGYTSASGTVNSGDLVTVRATSSSSNSTAVNAVLTIGTVSDTYTVTTAAPAVTTTLNPATSSSNLILSNNNLTARNVVNTGSNAKASTSHTTGKWVFAAKLDQNGGSSNLPQIGFALPSLSTATNFGFVANSLALQKDGSLYVNATTFSPTISANAALNWGGGGEVMVATDFDAKLVWLRVGASGNWNNSATANPATGAGGVSISGFTQTVIPTFFLGGNSTGQIDIITVNFGQNAFASAIPSGFAVWG